VKKEKERFDTIVEPLQCVLQLSLLSFCEKGTKITIQNNLVCLQYSNMTQGILRWYQNDSKEDLYFLFNAIRRFSLFYKRRLTLITCENDEYSNLYDLLIHYSILGLQNLIETYTCDSKPSLLYTLQMYKVLLENPESFNKQQPGSNIDIVFENITSIYTDNIYYIILHSMFPLINNSDIERRHKSIDSLNRLIKNNVDDIQTWISKNVIY